MIQQQSTYLMVYKTPAPLRPNTHTHHITHSPLTAHCRLGNSHMFLDTV